MGINIGQKIKCICCVPLASGALPIRMPANHEKRETIVRTEDNKKKLNLATEF